MSTKFIESLVAFITAPIKLYITIFIGTGIILFFPDSFIREIGLNNIKQEYLTLIGAGFILTIILLGIDITEKIYKCISEFICKLRFKKQSKKILYDLDFDAKVIVWLIYNSPNKTIKLPIQNGLIVLLESKLIISKTTNQCLVNMNNPKMPYTLNPWVTDRFKVDCKLKEEYGKIDSTQLKPEVEMVLKGLK